MLENISISFQLFDQLLRLFVIEGMILICHLTSAHPRDDVRIFHKMCKSLGSAYGQVKLVVADGKGYGLMDNVEIFDVGNSISRINRIRKAPDRILVKALDLNADIYHLHDPELIPIALKLKKMGHCVIFDFHEDVSRQLLNKPYLNKPLRWGLSRIYGLYEAWAAQKLDGLIAATPAICEKLNKVNPKILDINNYPIAKELNSGTLWANKKSEVCYIGNITRARGIVELVKAMGRIQSSVNLTLAGRFADKSLENSLTNQDGWSRINAVGFVDRFKVRDILSRSFAGVVTFHPLPNHIEAQPNKMFEYMSAGIPIIASDFPLWREIVAGNDCGLLVDPLKPEAIAEAIDYLVAHPEDAERMGGNGRLAVENLYNWRNEEQKLLAFYDSILAPEAKL